MATPSTTPKDGVQDYSRAVQSLARNAKVGNGKFGKMTIKHVNGDLVDREEIHSIRCNFDREVTIQKKQVFVAKILHPPNIFTLPEWLATFESWERFVRDHCLISAYMFIARD